MAATPGANEVRMTPIAPSTLSPVLLTAAVGFAYFRRIRRSFGRQPYRPRRGYARLALLAVAVVGLCFAALAMPVDGMAVAVFAGLGAGGALGAFALRHTRIELVDGARCYTPNPWIGGTLSLLLLGRLAWRYTHGAFAMGGAAAPQQPSPLTFGIAAILVGFYFVNGAGLAWRMRELATPRG